MNDNFSVMTISEEGIKNQSVSMLPDLFLGNSSVYMQKTNFGGGSPIIRGMIGNRVLILIDGIKVNNSIFRYGPNQYLNTINPHIIEHVEVINGPGSVMYGSDALGGVVNIITKSNLSKNKIESYSRYSTGDNGIYQNISLSGNFNPVSLLFSGSYKKIKDVNSGGRDNIQKPSGYNEYSLFLKAGYQINLQNKVNFNYQKNCSFDVPRTDRYVAGNDIKYLFNPQLRESYILSYNFDISDSFLSSIKTRLFYLRNHEGRENIGTKSPTSQTNDLDAVNTFGFTNNVAFTWLNNFNSIIGIDYYNDNVYSTRYSTNLFTGISKVQKPQFADSSETNILGIFLQNYYNYSRFTFSLGGRFSYNRISAELGEPFYKFILSKYYLSFNAGVLYKVIENNLNLVVNFSQGYRTPSLEDISTYGKSGSGSGARFDAPNTNISAEFCDSYEIGVKYLNTYLNTSLFYYYNRVSDFINPVLGSYLGQNTIEGYPVYVRKNMEKGYIYGFEWFLSSVFLNCINLQNQINYTYGQSITLDEPLSRIPPLNGKFSLSFCENNYSAEYYILWSDKQTRLSASDKKDFRIGMNGTKGFISNNLSFSYFISNWLFCYLKLENIFDEYYKTHGSGIYSVGRNLIVAVDLKI
ncbi:MAG: TonB-dependent receptor [bacterium]